MRPTSSVRRNWPSPSSGRRGDARRGPRRRRGRARGCRAPPADAAHLRAHGEAGRVLLDDEARKPRLAPAVGLRPRQQRDPERHVRSCVGDERLATVDQPAAVAPLGPGADPACVGTGVGLGEPERAERPPLGQGPQPALSLLVVPEEVAAASEPMVAWACQAAATDWSAWPICSMAATKPIVDMPIPPHSSGTRMPSRPELTHLAEEIGRAARLVPGQRRAAERSPLPRSRGRGRRGRCSDSLSEKSMAVQLTPRAAGGPGRTSTSRGGRSGRRTRSRR